MNINAAKIKNVLLEKNEVCVTIILKSEAFSNANTPVFIDAMNVS